MTASERDFARNADLDDEAGDTFGDGPDANPFAPEHRAPWRKPAGLAQVLDAWRDNPRVQRNLVLDELQPPHPASTVPIPDDVPPQVRGALSARGITELYAHQAEALALARRGRDLVVATPTASGKSLCYNLPVLETLARDPAARVLYLFPTKALARDQEEALRGMLSEAGLKSGAVTYDGDTPGDARRSARERASVVLTNPDMLHAGILPHHAAWARFFSNLAVVVIDELHTYRGVFGSHLANVLRRLQRVARFHGKEPLFVFASATIGNPAEHARNMLGRDVALVSESGAPSGERHLLVFNPPVVNPELGIRQSYVKAAVRLGCDLIRAQVPTLIFGQSRNNVEVMLKYLRDKLQGEIDPQSIQAYRGGYLPETRRHIEASLRDGSLRCVVSTNALELGIDIGMLDAVVCAGYPGSIASLWQRWGRGGRRKGPALGLLVASSMPLDQFFANQPDSLVGAPVESARIDPDNVEILVQHLKCAAFELPFHEGEAFGDLAPDALHEALGFLVQHQVLHQVTSAAGRRSYHWSTDSYPASHVSLRSVGWDNFVIIERPGESAGERSGEGGGEQSIGEMDWRSTHTMLHEQAIYQHDGAQYQVEQLDYDNHKAYVRRVEPDYYTTAETHTKVSVIEESELAHLGAPGGGGARLGLGDVSVVEKVVGYKKIKFHTHENCGYGEVHLPEMQMHTRAFWLTVPGALLERLGVARPVAIDALRGLGNAMHTVAAVSLMTDPRDIGRSVGGADHDAGKNDNTLLLDEFDPTLFLYDQVPGGVGLADRLFDGRELLLRRATQLIGACGCGGGCPGCVGPVMSGEAPGVALPADLGRKSLALRLVHLLDGGERLVI